MRCNDCKLHQRSMCQVLPKGSMTPDIYFIIDCPDDEDTRFGQILSGSRGRYLESFLRSLNISNYREFSLVRCVPYDTWYTNDKLGDDYNYPQNPASRQPDSEEISSCDKFLISDISKTNPKLIVTLGSVPTSWAIKNNKFKISKVHGTVYKATIGSNEYDVLATYSPSYIIKNRDNTDIVKQFFDDLKKASQLVNGTFVDVMKENKMTFALDYKTFKEYYVNNFINENILAYDIETNAELVFDKRFDIIGFSLAKKRNGIYVCMKALDYEMPSQDIELCKKLLVQIINKLNKVVVHNCLYEMPATRYNLNYDIPFDKLDDTLVMVKLLLGGHVGAGLKPNAQRIGYPSWEDDKDDYVEQFKNLMTRLKLVRYQPIINAMREGQNFSDILDDLLKEDSQNNNDKNQRKYAELYDIRANFEDLFSGYYSVDEYHQLFGKLSEKIVDGYYNGIPGTISYAWIPYRLLCKYGATDSLATFDLKEACEKRFDEESTAEVNLHDGYKYALMEHYAGHNIIMSSMKWDEKDAVLDRKNYEIFCLHSLKYLFKNKEVQNYVVESKFNEFLPDVIYDNYNDYMWDTYNKRLACTGEDSDGYRLYSLECNDNGKIKKIHQKHLLDNVELPESMINDIKSKILNIILNDVKSTNDIGKLKSYFNPASTISEITELSSKVLLSGDTKFCHFLKSLSNVVDDDSFSIDNYSGIDKEFLEKFIEYRKIDFNHWRDRIDPFNELKSIYESTSRFNSKDIQELVGNSNNLVLNGLDDTSQIMIYDDLKMSPINPDDPESWSDLFKWLLNLRVYKKSVKVISAYIDGKVGRGSVWVVDKSPLENGDDVFYRKREYFDSEFDSNNNIILGPDEDLVEQTNFGVGTAETGRWRSAYHVLPTGSSVKKLYRSRFKGGTILQPDFSANELRCIASAAHEENMLQAFRDGLDIHKSNAAKIYNVPYDEVTKFQRRFAKTMSFSTIYGASEYSVAENYFGGDLAKAHKLFTDFYAAFPKLKDWIESKHQEVLATHKVSVLTQRFLNIDFDPNDKASVSSALRRSGNYPIQSAASTVAAVVFCNIIRHQRDLGFKTKPICFIHDSLESDVAPYELISVIKYQQYELANGAKDYFGLALKADLSMGLSMGHECELSEFEILDDKESEANITLEGWKDEILDTIENWKLVYNIVEVIEDNTEEVYTPMDQMFIPRKAFDPSVFSKRYQGKIKIHIRYYDENGNISPMCNESQIHISNVWENAPFIDYMISDKNK